MDIEQLKERFIDALEKLGASGDVGIGVIPNTDEVKFALTCNMETLALVIGAVIAHVEELSEEGH